MQIIDTHSHLYLPQFKDDIDEVISRCSDAEVNTVLLPNIDTATIEDVKALVARAPGMFKPMMGLHPCSVKQDYTQQLERLRKELMLGGYTAVGEIGLDYYWDSSFAEQQKDAFRQQIAWAKELELPIVIHCRDSFNDIADILEELQDDKLRGVLHCFTGTVEEAKRITDLGFYLGIGGVVTFKNGGLDKVVAQLDLQHLILETDSPYLTPAPYRGKRNESSYTRIVAQKVADVQETSLEKVAEVTTANAKQLFKL